MKTPALSAVTLVNQSGKPVPLAFVKKWVADLTKLASREIPAKTFAKKVGGKELTIAFVDPKLQKQLNKQFRGKDYATDVLSFDHGDPSSMGELAICPQVIEKQAKEHGLTVKEELGYMVLHGFLHLLGYDHETSERDAKKMFTLQDRMFETLLKKPSKKAARRKPSRKPSQKPARKPNAAGRRARRP